MKRLFLAVPLALLSLGSSLALAETPQPKETTLSKQYAACMEKAAATVDMLDCMAAEETLQDARLNTMYKDLMKKLPKERAEKLKEAQRAWIKFRDAHAMYLSSGEGTAAGLVGSDWMVISTAERATQLANELDMVNEQ